MKPWGSGRTMHSTEDWWPTLLRTKDVTAVKSTLPTSQVGLNVCGVEFTGRTHQWRIALGAAERVVGLGRAGSHPGSALRSVPRRNVIERCINNMNSFS
jgi:hypothetical protein